MSGCTLRSVAEVLETVRLVSLRARQAADRIAVDLAEPDETADAVADAMEALYFDLAGIDHDEGGY